MGCSASAPVSPELKSVAVVAESTAPATNSPSPSPSPSPVFTELRLPPPVETEPRVKRGPLKPRRSKDDLGLTPLMPSAGPTTPRLDDGELPLPPPPEVAALRAAMAGKFEQQRLPVLVTGAPSFEAEEESVRALVAAFAKSLTVDITSHMLLLGSSMEGDATSWDSPTQSWFFEAMSPDVPTAKIVFSAGSEFSVTVEDTNTPQTIIRVTFVSTGSVEMDNSMKQGWKNVIAQTCVCFGGGLIARKLLSKGTVGDYGHRTINELKSSALPVPAAGGALADDLLSGDLVGWKPQALPLSYWEGLKSVKATEISNTMLDAHVESLVAALQIITAAAPERVVQRRTSHDLDSVGPLGISTSPNSSTEQSFNRRLSRRPTRDIPAIVEE